MTEVLVNAYTPLIVWTGLGMILVRVLPQELPRLLGRGLYWVGIPLQILVLARHTVFSTTIGIVPLLMVAALGMGIGIAQLGLWVQSKLGLQLGEALVGDDVPDDRAYRGSFLLSAVIGNTGFVGLAIAPMLVGETYTGWVVLYAVTHNLIGTYGLGVFLASYFGRSPSQNRWWTQLRDVFTAPPLWAFAIGSTTQGLELPAAIDAALTMSIWVVIPCALVLMGMRLSQLQGWQSLRLALLPTTLKILVMPGLMALLTTLLGLPVPVRLGLTLMAGVPSAFANLILSEEYNLDRDLTTSSITLTTIGLLVTIPLWLVLLT